MHIPQKIKADLYDRFNISVREVSSISGGDINEARLIVDGNGIKYFLKYSIEAIAADMLEKEGRALQILADTQCVAIPRVFGVGTDTDYGYLLLEHIERGNPSQQSWINFAKDLANLHRCTSDTFGLSHHNYIGKLVQENTPCISWINFYIDIRLTPQRNLLLADKQNAPLVKMLDAFMNRLPNFIIEDEPALIHGDLWSGNYHPDKFGKIFMIDPSISYSSREMDIAMSMLFGGFSSSFYEAYNDFFPLPKGWKSRMEIYQLYYLLVHVNLFGRSYIDATMRILRKYI